MNISLIWSNKFCAECGVQLKESNGWKPGVGPIFEHPSDIATGSFKIKMKPSKCVNAGVFVAVSDITIIGTIISRSEMSDFVEDLQRIKDGN